jgi:hypothetical protein
MGHDTIDVQLECSGSGEHRTPDGFGVLPDGSLAAASAIERACLFERSASPLARGSAGAQLQVSPEWCTTSERDVA